MDHSIELPIGFGMALAMNRKAMHHFCALSEAEQRRIIAKTHGISSRQQMQEFVQHLASEGS
nr:hypothetical protein [bacterium]